MTTRTLAAIALLLALSAPLKAEDVEAPLYTNWSRFPIGTSVTMKATVTQLGQTTITTTRTKLVSKSD